LLPMVVVPDGRFSAEVGGRAGGLVAAGRYDDAMGEFRGFAASRRNYDVAQGIGAGGQPQSGVPGSWCVGGVSSAELACDRA
jgi:hypothetical protein